MRMNYFISVIAVSLLLSGCIFSNVNTPSQAFNTQPIVAGEGSKIGVAKCSAFFLAFFAWGDCSVEKAMENGDITELNHVSQRVVGAPLFFAKFHTVVRGE